MSKFTAVCLTTALACIGCSRGEAPAPVVPQSPAVPSTESASKTAPAATILEPDTPAAKSIGNYYPLESPRTLTYTLEYNAFLIGAGKGKVVTTFEEQIVDGVAYKAQTTKLTGTSWDSTYTKLYRRTDEGVMVRELNGGAERPLLPLPWEAGTRWTAKAGDGITESEIVGFEDVTCGETIYRGCLQVRSALQGGNIETHWYAPNVGLVKIEVQGGRFKSTTTLTTVDPSVSAPVAP
ncbi:MAG: hypothetical protein Q8K78_06895 [Planctomycetaceae bacterium]|nr:hypothetical protein [Planctomycetaceae bacterium]